jgi:hypothetical protein
LLTCLQMKLILKKILKKKRSKFLEEFRIALTCDIWLSLLQMLSTIN